MWLTYLKDILEILIEHENVHICQPLLMNKKHYRFSPTKNVHCICIVYHTLCNSSTLEQTEFWLHAQ